ncbi:MAG: hypothetical protein ACR2OE_15010 [Thermomicrobiales bacterium]
MNDEQRERYTAVLVDASDVAVQSMGDGDGLTAFANRHITATMATAVAKAARRDLIEEMATAAEASSDLILAWWIRNYAEDTDQ